MVRKHFILQGFTLSELLIVISLIAIIAILGILTYQRQTIKGFDVKRKADLARLRVVFEDYYNDHNCYPQVATWNGYNCADGGGGQFFAPYLQGQPIPCDPATNERYLYITIPEDVLPSVSACSGYKLFAALGNLYDGDIPGSGCSPDPNKGCGYGPPTYPAPASFKYNYGISVGGTIANPVFDFDAPLPTPDTGIPSGNWICPPKIGNQAPQNCQYYSNSCRDLMITRGCSTYDDSHKYNCSALCNPGQTNVCTYLSECY
ncbi:MAG: prepilin-type N-terminal cleavage/methylation domain-containing protein [Candidatus Gottesmanbacteria bacterium]